MRAERSHPRDFEGLFVIEFVDEFGDKGTGTWTEDAVNDLKKPPAPTCGRCCHPPDQEARGTYVVVGRIKGGKVYGEHADGEPLSRWIPFLIEEDGA